MASLPKDGRKVLEGVLAINKPQMASSAGVLRDLTTHFDASPLFAPWLTHNRRNMILNNNKQKHIRNLKVKMGHGGTLDPMAQGVLIVGVGKGTKTLSRFLECTKTYECVVLFGAATDSYDAVGKLVDRAGYQHITRELVEEKLKQFRGKIMQKPSVFSALKVDGKKMYEYAREGKDIPEVAARPVEVEELEILEWLEPGTHEYTWPKEEAEGDDKEGAQKLLGIRKEDVDAAAMHSRKRSRSRSRSRSPAQNDDAVSSAEHLPKKPRTDSEPAMSGALPTGSTQSVVETAAEAQTATPSTAAEQPTTEPTTSPPKEDPTTSPQPPAVRLRMTVTSGFYVRSLCHDLGLACSSLALMASLIRTRQGDYTLGKNVLEYSDLEAGEEVWQPKVQAQLEEFMAKEGWEAEEVESEEAWQARRKGAAQKQRGWKERKEQARWRG